MNGQLTKRALQAQVEAANVDREDSNKVKQEGRVLSFTQEMSHRRQEVARVAAFGNKSVFVPTESMGVAAPILARMAASVGVDMKK